VLVAVERGSTRLDDLIEDDDQPGIAAVTIAELTVGIDAARGRRRAARRAFLDDVVGLVQVLDYVLAAVRRSGRPRGAHDLIIAATALAHGRLVVTVDQAGFTGLPGVVVRAPS
jgi:tRNA(fMet)-specific endonuclease VapC